MDIIALFVDDLFLYFVNRKKNIIFFIISIILYLINIGLSLILIFLSLAFIYTMIWNHKFDLVILFLIFLTGFVGLVLACRIPSWTKKMFLDWKIQYNLKLNTLLWINQKFVHILVSLIKRKKLFKYFALFLCHDILRFICCNLIMQFYEVKYDSLWIC